MRVPFFVTFDFTGGGRRGWLYTESSSRGRRGGAGAAPAGRPRGPRASRLSTLATVRRSTPRRRSPRRSPLAASPLLPPPLCLAAPFRDCEHSVSMIRSVCPYLSLQPAVLHVLSVCIFSCSWRRFRRCAERHFMHLVRLKTSTFSKGSATCCPNSGPISGRTPPSVWTPRARPEDQRDFRPDHAAMYVCMLN